MYPKNSLSRRQFGFRSAAWLLPLGLRAAETSYAVPKCTITPLDGHQAVFETAGKELARWHFPADYPRPYLFPLLGPSGKSLTRMGHPGAPNHDHHQSVWFAHTHVGGSNFWGNAGDGRIRQKDWLCYEDGADAAIMAVQLGWFSGPEQREIMEQTLIVISRPLAKGEHTLEFQSTFKPVKDTVELGKTNFGFLAVRVAKSISAHFGGGRLTDSEGRVGEPEIFGKQAKWMDYSGPVLDGVEEGITFMDHPANPRYPTHWHVRSDGWMGASFCLAEGWKLEPEKPLKLRYLLHAHSGSVNQEQAAEVQAEFTKAPVYEVVKGSKPHHQFELKVVGH
jgi:hypothetical protein